jgi:hypothetical protein
MKSVNLNVCHASSLGRYSQLGKLNVIDGTKSGSTGRGSPEGIARKTDVSPRNDRQENDDDPIHASNEDNSSEQTIGDILLRKEREFLFLCSSFFSSRTRQM